MNHYISVHRPECSAADPLDWENWWLNEPYPVVVSWIGRQFGSIKYTLTPAVIPTPEPRPKRSRARRFEAALFVDALKGG